MMKKKLNLRVKFLIFATAISLITILLLVSIITKTFNNFIEKETKKNLITWVNDFSNVIRPLLVYFDYPKLYSQVKEFQKSKKYDFLQIFDSNKKLIVQILPESFKNKIDTFPLISKDYLIEKKILNLDYYIYYKPIKITDSNYIWGYLIYGKSLYKEKELLKSFKNKLNIILIIIFVFFIISFQIFINIIIYPLKKIKNGLLKVYNGELSYRLKIKNKDEFKEISDLFNEMAEKIEVIMTELEATQKNLEVIVDDRTRELNKSNKKLKEAIEELKRTQERIIQTEKQKSLTTIVAGFAHEINNPLSGILGYVDLLVQRDDINDYIKNKLYSIKVQAERIKDIVNELDLLSPQLKRSELEINLLNLITKLIKINKIATNGIDIKFENELDTNASVLGNHYTLWQVLEAVFFNSVESIKNNNVKKGIIKIRLYEAVDGKNLVVEFRDNGGGFKDISRAFDPFYTTKQRANKRGIGLSIAYNIINEHNGLIFLENEKNWAVVKILLPKYKRDKNNSKTEEK